MGAPMLSTSAAERSSARGHENPGTAPRGTGFDSGNMLVLPPHQVKHLADRQWISRTPTLTSSTGPKMKLSATPPTAPAAATAHSGAGPPAGCCCWVCAWPPSPPALLLPLLGVVPGSFAFRASRTREYTWGQVHTRNGKKNVASQTCTCTTGFSQPPVRRSLPTWPCAQPRTSYQESMRPCACCPAPNVVPSPPPHTPNTLDLASYTASSVRHPTR